MKVFSDITSRNELATFLGVKRSTLTYLLYKKDPEHCYSSFFIPKKNGGQREISVPSNDLKTVQRKLASALWTHQKNIWNTSHKRPNISHAFEKGKSIITNANIHKNKRFVLNLDLENFFGSFHFGRVCGFFEKNRHFQLPRKVAIIIAQIACHNGCLPQGAPSSPIITNLICQIMDIRLLKIAKKYKMDYTRYADDLTFSTNRSAFLNEQSSFIKELTEEIDRSGFKLNEKKTRLFFKSSRQEVTGLTVNKKLSINSEYVRTTRAMAYRLYTQGKFEIGGEAGTIAQLEGRFAYIDQLDHHNNKCDGKKHDYWSLNGREKQYQAFLFYKYFFANKKPLIVTEGKTDVRYLKAALKAKHQEYPKLVKKISNNQYIFKISFLEKSKRLKYFLNIIPDGAGALNNIYYYYSGANNHPNLYCKFQKLSNNNPTNPVILFFDNESQSKDKPLKKFLNSDSLKDIREKVRAQIKKDNYSLLIPDSGLYLIVPPLASNQKECEIEDLFPQQVLDHIINGKSFHRGDKFDNTKYYGKEVFSKYIMANYQSLDFSGFKPLLDMLNTLISSYSNDSLKKNS
ncbi:MAG: retron Ec67 family RNA-directed DNA polymerase/endonuclease [Christensenellales bacterium]